MKEIVLIPEERLGAVKNKETKGMLESKLNVKIYFEDNTVEIDGEGLELYKAKLIVKSIGRGFSPDNAFRLLDDEEQLQIIELRDYSEKKMQAIKARVIGGEGKTRKLIEKFSGCAVSIYGKTISLIGNFEQLQIAKEAVNMIIYGAKLTTVYGFLQKAKIPKE